MRSYFAAMLGASVLATRIAVDQPWATHSTNEKGDFEGEWHDLHADDRKAFECLGWDVQAWDDWVDIPASEEMTWHELSQNGFLQCAIDLGYT